MAVTSQMRHLGKIGEAEVRDWQQAGLIKPSLIKPILATIEKALVLKKLGSLSDKDCQVLQEILRKILGKSENAEDPGAETRQEREQ